MRFHIQWTSLNTCILNHFLQTCSTVLIKHRCFLWYSWLFHLNPSKLKTSIFLGSLLVWGTHNRSYSMLLFPFCHLPKCKSSARQGLKVFLYHTHLVLGNLLGKILGLLPQLFMNQLLNFHYYGHLIKTQSFFSLITVSCLLF